MERVRVVGLESEDEEREEERVRRVGGLEREQEREQEREERVRREEASMGARLLMGNSRRIILLLSLCLQLYRQSPH